MDGRPLKPGERDRLRARLPELDPGIAEQARVVELAPWTDRSLEDDLLLVLDGEGHYLGLGEGRRVGPGRLVFDTGLLGSNDQRHARFRSADPCVVARVPLPRPVPLGLLSRLEEEMDLWFEELDEREAVELRALHDRLNEDGTIKAGPYELNRTRLLLVVLDHPPWPARKPARALPFVEDPGLLLVLADYPEVLTEGAEPMVYREAAVFAPRLVVSPVPRICLETRWIRPDDRMATLLGRELFGLPKRVGSVELPRGQRYATVSHGATHLRLRWTGHRDIHDAEVAAEASLALLGKARKSVGFGRFELRVPRIPRVPSSFAAWRSLPTATGLRRQLVECQMSTTRVGRSVRLEGVELRIAPARSPSEVDPYPPQPVVPPGTSVRGAWEVELDLVVTDGRVL